MLVAFVKHIKYSTYAGKWQGISCVEVEIILCGDRCVNCNNICPLGMGIVAFFVSLVVFLLHRHINWLNITVRHKNI